jgi:hypothetical protein
MPRPRFNTFAHASLFCRDLAQAKRFFMKVIGGELIHDVDGFAEVRVAGIIIGMTERPGRPTGRDAEYPHYAFFIASELDPDPSLTYTQTVSGDRRCTHPSRLPSIVSQTTKEGK